MAFEETPPEVRLEGVPAALFIESQNHQHDLLREFALMDIGNRWSLTERDLPQRVAELIGEILQDYAEVRMVTRRQALDALSRGDDTVTLRVPVKPGIVDALHRWLQLVETADAFCEQGVLLTLAAKPEVRRLRRWYVQAIAERLRR
ncbi:MAG TPA: hypothetical protein VM324_09435 [Egibacteraceae bacterium]|jgi:hypothetical protein|nr:hypothetical protein [Egibacteraceae bacterium]